jgi:hypothetical protein
MCFEQDFGGLNSVVGSGTHQGCEVPLSLDIVYRNSAADQKMDKIRIVEIDGCLGEGIVPDPAV